MPTHHIDGLLSDQSVGEYLLIKQDGKTIEPEGLFQITQDRLLNVSATISTDKPYRVRVKKPFRLIGESQIE